MNCPEMYPVNEPIESGNPIARVQCEKKSGHSLPHEAKTKYGTYTWDKHQDPFAIVPE